MKAKTIYFTSENPFITWGNLKAACIALGLSYNTVVKNGLPFHYGNGRLDTADLWTGTNEHRSTVLNQ